MPALRANSAGGLLHLRRGDRKRLGRFRDRRLNELLTQTLIDRRGDGFRVDSFRDLLRQLYQSLIELRLMRCNGLTDFPKSFRKSTRICSNRSRSVAIRSGACTMSTDRELHGPQNPQHLIVLGQGTAMAHLAVVVGPYFDRQRIRDAVDEIRFRKVRRLGCRVHGNSNSFTLSNSANMRRR